VPGLLYFLLVYIYWFNFLQFQISLSVKPPFHLLPLFHPNSIPIIYSLFQNSLFNYLKNPFQKMCVPLHLLSIPNLLIIYTPIYPSLILYLIFSSFYNSLNNFSSHDSIKFLSNLHLIPLL
jgi:hypothetical protein